MRYWIDGECHDLEDERVSARIIELERYGRPTTSQRSELQQLLSYRERQGKLEAAHRSGRSEPGNDRMAGGYGHAEHPELHGSGRMIGQPDIAIRSARNRISDLHDADVLPSSRAELFETAMSSELIGHDERWRVAEYVTATSDPAYRTAFAKLISMGREQASMVTSPQEREAIARVLGASRAMGVYSGGGANGGYAVPFTLDPTVIGTSAQTVNPLRQIARVEHIVGKAWYGVTSAGVTVSRAAEATEASDNSPSLGQPTVTPTRVQGFVPFSIELDQDWGALQSEVARMLADAKQAEEDSFVTGDGTGNNPSGVIATLGTASQVSSAGTAVVVLGDVQNLVGQLSPRWRARARFAASLPTQLALARLEKVSTVSAISGSGSDKQLLDIPISEISAMDTGSPVADATSPSQKFAATSSTKPLLYGDFSQFLIVERIGMTVELIPHLFGPSNRYPTGQRGIYAMWRNSSEILVQDAFRILKIK
jgi:HK97 family phage major capsid protein